MRRRSGDYAHSRSGPEACDWYLFCTRRDRTPSTVHFTADTKLTHSVASFDADTGVALHTGLFPRQAVRGDGW